MNNCFWLSIKGVEYSAGLLVFIRIFLISHFFKQVNSQIVGTGGTASLSTIRHFKESENKNKYIR